jgi:hypothetical protein
MNRKKFLTMAVLAIMIASGIIIGLQATAQEGPVYKNVSASVSSLLGSNPVTTEMNFTFGRVAYTNEPTQFMWSSTAGYPSESFVTQTGEWVTNNSGYQFMIFNSTTSALALETYAVSGYLGPNVSYFYNDQRVGFNGSATSYIYLGETALTGLPAASDVLATSAGPSQNNVYLEISPSSGNYSAALYYYESVLGGNAKYYQNQTSVALTGTMNPLELYDITFNIVPSTGLEVTIEDYQGNIINQTIVTGLTLRGNISKIAYLQYGITGSGLFAGDYGYIVDHNTYPSPSAVMAGAMAPDQGIAAAFGQLDPGVANTSLTQSMNESSVLNVNMSESAFSNVTPSGSNASMTSSELNSSLFLGNSSTEASSGQTVTTVRGTSGPETESSTGTIYITSWTPEAIQSEIISFLQNYISAKTGYTASDITIVSYLITNIGFNYNFSSQAMTSLQNYIDSMVPGMLQSSNLSLVNTTTGAIMAGAAAGDFYDFYMDMPVAPIMTSEGILNPVTGVTYSDVELAGFPSGSYISGGSIVVPGNIQFYGFTASGVPIMGAGWNPFAGLSSAGKAVMNFFHSASSTVQNALVKPISNGISAVIKPIGGTIRNDMTTFAGDVSRAVTHAVPVLGATLTNVKNDIVGSISKAIGPVSSALASIKNGAVGAILTGVGDIRNTFYHLGSGISSGLNTAKDVIINTLGKVRGVGGAILSGITTSVRNIGGALASLGGSIASHVTGALQDGKQVLDSVGTDITTGLSGAYNAVKNAFGDVGHSITSITGAIAGSIGNAVHTVFGFSSSLGKVLEYVVIGAGIVIVVLLTLFFAGYIGGGKSRGRKGRKERK